MKPQAHSGVSCIESSFICAEVLAYLLCHQGVDELAQELGIWCEKGQKMTVIMEIVIHMRKVWTIAATPRYLQSIQRFQRHWRQSKLPDMGPYPTEPCVNEEDVFLLKPIAELPAHEVFSFKDETTGQVFAFHAAELGTHVFQFKNTFNPLTREPIPIADLKRLRQWMSVFRKGILIDDALFVKTWSSPLSAFTDVTSDIERIYGIMTQPMWYTSLDQYDILNVFSNFHKHAGPLVPWMDRTVEEDAFDQINPVVSQMALATEMHRFLQSDNVDNHLFYMCCLCVALAGVSAPIRQSLPHWVWEVV